MIIFLTFVLCFSIIFEIFHVYHINSWCIKRKRDEEVERGWEESRGLAGSQQRVGGWSGHTPRVEEHLSWWRHLEGPISASTSVISSRFPRTDCRFLPVVSFLLRRQLCMYIACVMRRLYFPTSCPCTDSLCRSPSFPRSYGDLLPLLSAARSASRPYQVHYPIF